MIDISHLMELLCLQSNENAIQNRFKIKGVNSVEQTAQSSEEAAQAIEKIAEVREKILQQLRQVIVGQDAVVEQILMALFTGGHCLMVGVPGLAKTLIVRSLARILDLSFSRIQFTPDLMPADRKSVV